MLASEREELGADALGPTLVVCPMSVVKQWAHEIERFAPSLRVLSHHGVARLTGDALVAGASSSDVVVTSYDIATRDIETLARVEWDRLLLDEAQDVKNPATKRARALRRLRRASARRDDRHADREPARRALGDHGHRQSGAPRLARVVRPHARAADRGVRRRAGARAAARHRAAVRPAPREGLARGRARAAADHDRQGLLPADRRAGEPLPGDGRPLDAADRGAAGQLRPARVGARDAEPAEAGVQPPGAPARDRPAARGPQRQARPARRAARAGAGGRQGARLHAVPGLRPARAVSRTTGSARRSASSTAG